MGLKEAPKLAAGYQPLRSTRPPEERTSTSGKFAAVVPRIPGLAPVNFPEDESNFPTIEIAELDESTIQIWLEQFAEFNSLDEKTRLGVLNNLQRYLSETKRPISDEELISHFQHLLSIKNGQVQNVARRNFEKSDDKWSYFDFFVQHFREWELINKSEQIELKNSVFNFLTASDTVPPNEEIAIFISKIHALHIKKITIRNRVRAQQNDLLPEPVKGPIIHHFQNLIDEQPETSIDAFMVELERIIFAIIQERTSSAQSGSPNRISQELRIVARVIETRSAIFQPEPSPEDMRATLPEVPSAKAIDAVESRKRVTIPAAPMARTDKAPVKK